MAELKGSINIKRNIEKCFEMVQFTEDNIKRLDKTVLFHTVENETENKINSRYLQGRDDNGNVFEVVVEICEYIDQEDYKKIGAFFNVENYFRIDYYYELAMIDSKNTTLTYYTKTTPTKFFTKLLYKILKIDKKLNVDNFLEHVKELIETN